MSKTHVAALVAITLALIAAISSAQDQGARTLWQSKHFVVTAASGGVLPPIPEVRARFDEIFEYVSERVGVPGDVLKAAGIAPLFGASLDPESGIAQSLAANVRIKVLFLPPFGGACPVRGRALGGRIPAIDVFANEQTAANQVFAVLAHELGHLFQWTGVGRGGASGLFEQGFASWAAGKYWTDWYGAPSLSQAISELLEQGRYIPLSETNALIETIFPRPDGSSSPNCLENRTIVYTEWAAFVEFLVETYGRDKLFAFVSRPTDVGQSGADQAYLDVYGSSLAALEAAWMRSLQ